MTILWKTPLENGEEMLTYFDADGHLHTGVAVPDGQFPSEFAIHYRCACEYLTKPKP